MLLPMLCDSVARARRDVTGNDKQPATAARLPPSVTVLVVATVASHASVKSPEMSHWSHNSGTADFSYCLLGNKRSASQSCLAAQSITSRKQQQQQQQEQQQQQQLLSISMMPCINILIVYMKYNTRKKAFEFSH